MKCPHCLEELPARECPECGEKIPLFGKFCSYCGSALVGRDTPNPNAGPSAASDGNNIDFSKRVLCSDGTCIGVINENGVCNECGKPYTGEAE
ncbi:MAG: hypothetical protein PVG85_00405 [Deltaproteobacteria bacterium]